MEAGAAAEQSEQARVLAATLLNAGPDEIAPDGGTSPGQRSRRALGRWRAGERWSAATNGAAILLMHALAAREAGASVETIPCAPDGTVDPAALGHTLDERVRLIALTAAGQRRPDQSGRGRGPWRAAMASRTSSMPRRRSASCRSTWPASAATC